MGATAGPPQRISSGEHVQQCSDGTSGQATMAPAAEVSSAADEFDDYDGNQAARHMCAVTAWRAPERCDAGQAHE
jgi:hypothetical protein